MLIHKRKDIDELAWQKMDGLLPAIVQDAFDGRVLMQAYMNREALQTSLESGRVTFWSRSRQALWTKGETSGNTLELIAVHADCDSDCILVLAKPHGPSCHRGTDTCFDGALSDHGQRVRYPGTVIPGRAGTPDQQAGSTAPGGQLHNATIRSRRKAHRAESG